MSAVLHHIDAPTRWDNPVPLLIVRGWCFAQGGPDVVGVRAQTGMGAWDGVHGLARPDVAAAFSHAPGSAESGFVIRVPRPAGPAQAITFEALLEDGSRQLLASVQTR